MQFSRSRISSLVYASFMAGACRLPSQYLYPCSCTLPQWIPMFFTAQLMLDVLQSSLSHHRLCILLHEWSSRWRLAKVLQAFTVLRSFLPRCEPVGYDMGLAHTSYQIEQVTAAWAAMRHSYLSSLIPQASPDFALIEALCEYSQCAFVTSSRMVPIYAILMKYHLRLFMATRQTHTGVMGARNLKTGE